MASGYFIIFHKLFIVKRKTTVEMLTSPRAFYNGATKPGQVPKVSLVSKLSISMFFSVKR